MAIGENFVNATPGRQAVIIISAALMLGGFIFGLYYFLLRTDYRPAFSGLQPGDAATIVGELEQRKQPYKLSDGGRVILLPADRVDAIRLEIMGADLPLRGTIGFELFNKSDMGLTDFAQKINYQRALQGELARTILAMENVENVRVHLALGEDRLFRENQTLPKASVMVRMKNDEPIPSATAQGIQQLVAAAVNKLDPANVVVLGESGRIASVVTQPAIVETSALGQEKRAIEAFYAARVRKAVDATYPSEAVGVQIWAAIEDGANENANSAGWSPENRKFRLHVNLAPVRPLASGARQDIENLAASAIGLDPALGDTISFGTAPAPAAGPFIPQEPRGTDSRRPPAVLAEEAMEDSGSGAQNIWLSLAVSALIGFAFWLFLRRRNRLTRKGRADFADRLAQLLRDDEEEHVGRA